MMSFSPAILVDSGESGKILLVLFVVLVAAKLFAELFERIGQPAAVGEILAGVVIGPCVLKLVSPAGSITALAEIGVVFLLFTVGLETRPADIFKVGGTATAVAVLGVIIPFVAGWLLLSVWPGHSWIESVFLGASMVATSVGITARVLSSLGLVTEEASRVILAAAVIDDVIGLLVLAVVSSLATGHINYVHIAVTSALAIAFAIGMVTVGSHAVKRVKKPVHSLKINHSLLVFSLVLCFGLAAVATSIGIAGIVGAFLAGVALSEASEGTDLHHQAQTLTEFTAPFFLVNVGMQLNPRAFSSASTLVLSAIVVALAIITKMIGCGLAASHMGRKRALQVGVGMIPRGEVGIVVAQIGLTMGIVSDAVYAVVLTMVVLTTIIAPTLIKMAFAEEAAPVPVPVDDAVMELQ